MGNLNLSKLNIDKKEFENVLKEMGAYGFLVDQDIFMQLRAEFSNYLKKIEKEIFDLFPGINLNLNSPKQLSDLMYGKLKLPIIKQRGSFPSTDELTLNKLKDLHPVIPLLIEYRHINKFISILDLLLHSIANDGRIHSTFVDDGAVTGRLASKDPNLQNIPVRGELGVKLRKGFICLSDCILISADYAQIELRILAYLSQEDKLIDSFRQNEDIHTTTASEIFNIEKDKITEDQRRIAKTVNFGIIYGITPFGLAENLGIDQKEAKYFIDTYKQKYPKVTCFLEKLKKEGIEKGYVETLSGNKKFISQKAGFNERARERMALNYPIQGSAAEIIKLAMVEIDRIIKKNNLKTKMILQIHDELLFESPFEEKGKILAIIKQEMENPINIGIDLLVSIEEGKNWGEMKKIQ